MGSRSYRPSAKRYSITIFWPSIEEVWGDDDYEFWVDVPATALHKLVSALIRDKYSDRNRAVDEFREFCIKQGIEHKWESWI
jgi:hypothetical protein